MYRGIIPLMGKGQAPFIIEVKTNNAGTSTSSQFTIPTTGTGYSYTVKTSEQTLVGQTGDVTLQWSTAGTYDVEIYGNFPRIFFNNLGDRLKLLKVKQWGSIRWSSFDSAFWGCSNLDITATESPILNNVTTLFSCFRSCSSLVNSNGSIGSWNTSTITNMQGVFGSCVLFNQNIGSWNVSNVSNFGQTSTFGMFQGATAFNNGGNSSIGNWSIKTTGTVSMQQMFQSATAFNQNIGSWNTSAVTNMSQMFRSSTAFNQNIGSWNVSAVTNMSSMFLSATSFNQNIGSWNVSESTSFANMFSGATAFNNGGSSDINNWSIKTTGTVSMANMFFGATTFNQNIGSWNTTAVTSMANMFTGATNFNQNIGSWNTAAVASFSDMFNGATAFNQNIGSWNVSASTTFLNMFAGATAFNNGGSSDINNWLIKTTGTVSMQSMFRLAIAFNQNIGSWNTVAVTSFLDMFNGAIAFNQNIGSWNTIAVASMQAMFTGATSFNQNISSWNVSACTTFLNMFSGATSFNQNLGSWALRLSGVSLVQIFQSASAMTTANYTNTIVGWANYVFNNAKTPISVSMTTQTGRIFQNSLSGGANFANAGDARTYLTTVVPTGAGWTISGDTVIA